MSNKINIILAAYNGEKYISELIDSILGSSYKDFTLFICDDCSKDNTGRIAEEYVAKHPDHIRYLKNERNMGSTLSFLENLKKVRDEYPADYYMFCDQDDVWLSDKIAVTMKQMKHIEKRRGRITPVVVFSDALLVDEGLNYVNRSFYRTNRLRVRKNNFSRMLMENKCIGCTMLMNASLVSLLDATGPKIRFHDWWMSIIASAFGIIRYNRTPTVLYRQHGGNQVGQADFHSYVRNRADQKQDVRERLQATYDQAEFFYEVYGDRLPKNKRKHLRSFMKLRTSGFFARRLILIKNRFFKSGVFRNIGLLFYI